MEKILFVSFHTRGVVGIRTLSSILKNKYVVDILFFMDFEVMEPTQKKIKINYLKINRIFNDYKYILITVSEYTKKRVLNILKNINQENRDKIILGGPAVITNSDYFSKFAKHLCFWEGENIDIYLKNINNKKNIPNFNKSKIYYQIDDLDNLPFQNTEFNNYYFYIKNKIIIKKKFDYKGLYTMETVRGCPFNCTFCTNRIYNQIKKSNKLRLIRKKSINQVFKELIFFKDKGFNEIDVVDDNFFLRSLKAIKEFVSRYNKEINLPIYLNLDMRSKDFLKKFQEINKIKEELTISLGIQNGDENFRKDKYNRIISNELIIALDRGMYKIKNNRINILYEFIWGHPCETKSNIIKSINLIKKLDGSMVLCRYNEFGREYIHPFNDNKISNLGNKSFLYIQMFLFTYLKNKNIKVRIINPIKNKVICKFFSNYILLKVFSFFLSVTSEFKRRRRLQNNYHYLNKIS